MQPPPSDQGSSISAACNELDDEPTLVDGIASGAMPARIAEWIQRGKHDIDREFDRYLPVELRVPSRNFWTPICVAARVAAWLDELSIRSLLDIGSGPGKFCVVGALAGSCAYLGIEQRPRLVEVSRTLAELFRVGQRVCFLEGVFGETEAPLVDAYYLYNPFGENLYGAEDHLDNEVELTEERYQRDVAATERMLRDAPVGTVIITYNGFGGMIPTDYLELRRASDLPNVLRLMQRI